MLIFLKALLKGREGESFGSSGVFSYYLWGGNRKGRSRRAAGRGFISHFFFYLLFFFFPFFPFFSLFPFAFFFVALGCSMTGYNSINTSPIAPSIYYCPIDLASVNIGLVCGILLPLRKRNSLCTVYVNIMHVVGM